MALLPLTMFAQTPDEDFCGTETSAETDPVGVYSRSVDPNVLANYDPVSFNIFYWGVAQSDGTWIGEELTLEKVKESVEFLNEAFNPYKICFNLVGMDIIKKDSIHNGALYGEVLNYATQNGYFKENAYNIYVPNLFCCYSGVTNYYSTNIGIRVGAVASPTFIHEMGHTFNLYHTFESNNDRPHPVYCEQVTRNTNDPEYNADIRGDKVHDTNAVPNFQREQHNHMASAIEIADIGYTWQYARDSISLNPNGFHGYTNANDIELALYYYSFTEEEVEYLKYNPAVNYAYYDENTHTYTPDIRVYDPGSAFFKDCAGTPYQITSTDIKNYMAYTRNESRQLFTTGQGIRMREAIEYKWNQVFSNVEANPYDLFIKDHGEDIAQEPNIHTNIFWNSPDIWVRNQQDGVTNQVHQNPEYDPVNPNYIYVKIRNKSCGTSSGNDILKVYWSKATIGYSWPYHWDGSWVVNGIPMGGELAIAIPNIPAVLPNGEAIVEIPWMVPDPDDYIGISSNPWHFSLLARIESTEDPMAYTEGYYTSVNVRNNNNIAWKNVNVVDLIPNVSTPIGSVIALSNPTNQSKAYNLRFFKEPGEPGKPIYEEAEVGITLDSTLVAAWNAGGNLGSNYTLANVTGNKLVATGDNMELNNIVLDAYEYANMYVTFNFLTAELTSKSKFVYHITQEDEATEEVYGGDTFVINKLPRSIFSAYGGEDEFVKMNDEVTLYATPINEDAVYNWYDPEGNLIYTGTDLTVSSSVTQTYKLEVIAETDGYKDYDEVTVNITPYQIESLVPNPVNSQLTVTYDAQGAGSAYLMLVNQTTGNSDNYILDTEESLISIDVSGFSTGLYSVILVCDGDIHSVKNLAKQ